MRKPILLGTIFLSLLATGLTALWVRSWFVEDILEYHTPRRAAVVMVTRGHATHAGMSMRLWSRPDYLRLTWLTVQARPDGLAELAPPSSDDANRPRYGTSPRVARFSIPLWIPAVAAGLWPLWRLWRRLRRGGPVRWRRALDDAALLARQALLALTLAAGLLVFALWPRSYWVHDQLREPTTAWESHQGQLLLTHDLDFQDDDYPGWLGTWYSAPVRGPRWPTWWRGDWGKRWGGFTWFGWEFPESHHVWSLGMPHWLAGILLLAWPGWAAFGCWRRRRKPAAVSSPATPALP